MMSESGFKTYVRKNMRGKWKHQNIESPTTNSGIPDTYYSMTHGGWIEYKFQIDWPKRTETVLKVKNFKKEQKLWILLHGRLTGRVFFFIKIGKDYLIYDCIAAQKVGSLTKRGMMRYAIKVWHGKINFSELEMVLRTGYKNKLTKT